MPELALRDKTAIAGVGWSPFSRGSGTTVLNLTTEACLNAIADAGLTVQDIDGLITYYWASSDTVMPHELATALNIRQCNYELYDSLGGSWSCAAVLSAAMAVYAGLCDNVLVYRSMNGASERVPRAPSAAHGSAQWTVPFGTGVAAASYGHHATAHMARYGTTTLDFAHLAVTQRKHASLNQKAVMRRPLTVEDHQNSRWIVYPFRLLDCCLQTDGAAAVIVTSAERARDLRHPPAYIMSGVGGTGLVDALWETNAVNAAPLLYRGAGISPADVDVAEIYDPFTFMCLTHIEDFGLVPKGEVGGWVSAGKNGLDGEIPVNTHGGLLSEAYIQGLNHVVEAVQQLRPGGVVDDLCEGPHTYDRSQCRQVRDPEIALVTSEWGSASLLLRKG